MKTTELTDIDGDALTITQRLDATWITCTKGDEEVTIGPVPTDAVRHAFETPMGGDDMDGGVTAAIVEKETATIGPALLEAALAAALKDTRELTRERDDARGDCNDALRREKAEQDRAVKAEYERDEARDTAARYLQQRRDAVLRAEKAELKQVEADGALKAYVTAQTSRSARELIEAAWGNGYRHRGGVIPAGTDHMLRDVDGLIYIDRADHELPGFNDGVERRLIDPPAPARPAGAEQLDPLVDRAIRGCSDITTPETVRAIANGLAEEGVRVVTEDGGER